MDIEQLARESDIDDSAPITLYMLQRLGVFASAVRRDALEECAKICGSHHYAETAAEAIRALKDKPAAQG